MVQCNRVTWHGHGGRRVAWVLTTNADLIICTPATYFFHPSLPHTYPFGHVVGLAALDVVRMYVGGCSLGLLSLMKQMWACHLQIGWLSFPQSIRPDA